MCSATSLIKTQLPPLPSHVIIVKCLAQGHKHHGRGQVSNPSDDSAIRVQGTPDTLKVRAHKSGTWCENNLRQSDWFKSAGTYALLWFWCLRHLLIHPVWLRFIQSDCRNCLGYCFTGCPHKKYTEIKINIMVKLLYIWEREIYL